MKEIYVFPTLCIYKNFLDIDIIYLQNIKKSWVGG